MRIRSKIPLLFSLMVLLATGVAGLAADTPREKPTSRKVAPEPAKARCLPVVAEACGCVYSCGVGWPAEGAAGTWTVRHAFWGETPLKASVGEWCVDRQCTQVFKGEIVCGGICPPRPADPTCHFDDDLCVGRP
jgi:hypothetical protein